MVLGVVSKEKAGGNGRDQPEGAPVWEPSGVARRIHSLCCIPGNTEEQMYKAYVWGRDIWEEITKKNVQGLSHST